MNSRTVLRSLAGLMLVVSPWYAWGADTYCQIYRNQALPILDKLGVTRIQGRENDLGFNYDVFAPKSNQRPSRVALLSRSLSKKRNGSRLEILTLKEGGKEIKYPQVSVPSAKDLSNVDQIAKEEGLSRSGAIRPSLTNSDYQVFILYR